MEYRDILKKSLLFSGLDDENLAEVAAIATKRSFAKGEALFAEGETVIRDVACADTSFPGFARLLASAAPACAIREETADG